MAQPCKERRGLAAVKHVILLAAVKHGARRASPLPIGSRDSIRNGLGDKPISLLRVEQERA